MFLESISWYQKMTCVKSKVKKEALQENLSLTFTEHNGVVAAYTNVKNTVEWLLSKKNSTGNNNGP